MSLPSFPNKDNIPTREEVVNQIIASIAMEELGLSHIINAEGEKIQYALGTIPDIPGPDEPLTMEELLKLNESVHKTLDSTMMNQFFLKEKLLSALSASVMRGPQGPAGPQGPSTIDVIEEAENLEPGTSPYVKNKGSIVNAKLKFGIPRGDPGLVGTILDSYDTYDELIKKHPSGNRGDIYLAGGALYVWDADKAQWENMGDLRGPQGTGTTIKGTGSSKAQLDEDFMNGPPEDAYLVDGEIYIWNPTDMWHSAGNLKGPAGERGPQGPTSIEVIDEAEKLEPGDTPYVHNKGTDDDLQLKFGIPRGTDGKSAYEVAVKNGFKGTEAEWLNSLKASSVTILPFASQQAPYVGANASGEPVNAALVGFGYLGFNTGIGGEDAHVAVPIDSSDKSFNLGASGNENRQTAFSLPFDMKLNSIYLTTGNWKEFVLIPAGTEVFPYVQIYTAPAGTNNFLPLAGAVAKPLDGLHPESAKASTMIKAEINGLDIKLDAGTRIAICGMMEIHGDSAPREYYLYFTGGIGLSNWVK